jgi:Family of unknown function (DUF6220)
MSSGDRLTGFARLAFVATARVFVICLVIQLFLVGLDVFEVISRDNGIHREFAYVYGWLAPLLVLLAGVSGAPRRQVQLAAVLLVLFAIQTYLPSLAEELPLLAALHAVNALAVFWLALTLARRSSARVEPASNSGGI